MNNTQENIQEERQEERQRKEGGEDGERKRETQKGRNRSFAFASNTEGETEWGSFNNLHQNFFHR